MTVEKPTTAHGEVLDVSGLSGDLGGRGSMEDEQVFCPRSDATSAALGRVSFELPSGAMCSGCEEGGRCLEYALTDLRYGVYGTSALPLVR